MKPVQFQRRYDAFRRTVNRRLASLVKQRNPRDLTDACRYVLTGGGKRIRAILAMLSCEAVGGRALAALDAGTAIELMHNFTLVHDDIMDNAASRRGRPTVHERWDVNNALLVGDVLIGLATKNLLRTRDTRLEAIGTLFADGLVNVCEGQALDLEYERAVDVTVRDYFRMIAKKTGRLFAAAAEIGALIGGGTRSEASALSEYGRLLGRAFQLRDDLLDVVADSTTFGKQIGGDIVEGKKTFLLLTALSRARGHDREFLERFIRRSAAERSRPGGSAAFGRASIPTVTAIYRKYGVIEETLTIIRRDSLQATAALAALHRSRAVRMLGWLSGQLAERIS